MYRKQFVTSVLRSTTNRSHHNRFFCSSLINHGKALDGTTSLIRPVVVQQEQQQELKLSNSDSYSQLPDDSQFITQHYDELVKFKKYLLKTHQKTYKDYENPNELIVELDNFIETQLRPGYWHFDIPLDLEVEYFMKFLHNLKICLRLNGGHTFVLDILLLNKECFDELEKNKKK